MLLAQHPLAVGEHLAVQLLGLFVTEMADHPGELVPGG